MILDAFLRITHGPNLTLQNIAWKASKETLPTPILGRRLLESLGCDNRVMLMAPRDKYGSDINVKERLIRDGNKGETSGKTAALFGESAFHIRGAIEDDGLELDGIYVDFGDDAPEEICK